MPNNRNRKGRGPLRWKAWAAVGCLLAAPAGPAGAQAQRRDFLEPILVQNSDGHHGPVSRLLFADDPARPGAPRLLSAGWDKVVHVWDLAEPAHPVQTIRPPVWRGLRGEIRAMALAPRPDAEGQRLLALAGVGVEAGNGTIGLYRFPGRDAERRLSGDVVAFLRSGRPQRPLTGHNGEVNRLEFDPTGAYLASGGSDGQVLLWDVAGRRVATYLAGHAPQVHALAFFRAGTRLVTGDGAGTIRLWDYTQPARPLAATTLPNPGAEPQVNDLAISPDGKWVVAGTQDGRLSRLDGANLGGVRPLSPEVRGPIHAVAISPDGTRLAVAVESRALPDSRQLPSPSCDVDLYDLPGERLVERFPAADNLVFACAFSPDGHRLAFAGGDAQAIRVRDLDRPDLGPTELRGHGASIRDVGFSADGAAVGFSRRPPGPDNRTYEGFHLRDRRPVALEAGKLARASATLPGWSIRPVDPFTLEAIGPNRAPVALRLVAARDGRWWSYSLLRPRAAGEAPMAAVGCGGGIAIFNLDRGGARTRDLAGHEGPVYALAESPDGRWLASGSADQTVRLWTLDGAGRIAPFGATFARGPDGAVVVAGVERASFADDMDLRKGDVLDRVDIGTEPIPLDPVTLKDRLDRSPPHANIQVRLRNRFEDDKGTTPVQRGSTKRHSPALNLFAAERPRGEWVLWTPQGFYDTSIQGDSLYLGWHRNQGDLDRPEPTRHFPIKEFEPRLRKKALIDRLLALADPRAVEEPATAEPNKPKVEPIKPKEEVAQQEPPRVAIEGKKPPGNAGLFELRAMILSGVSPVDRTEVFNSARRVLSLQHPPNSRRIDQTLPVPLDPGPNRISVRTFDLLGRQQTRSLDIDGTPDPKADADGRLTILALGTDRFASARLPGIALAEKDATDLVGFFRSRQARPVSGRRFETGQVEAGLWLGAEATRERFDAALDRLSRERFAAGDRAAVHDVLVVIVESHLILGSGPPRLATAETGDEPDPGRSLPADALAERLGKAAASGCRVIVLLDVVHRRLGRDEGDRLTEWVRDLRDRRNVVVVLASNGRPSEPVAAGPGRGFARLAHRVFAQAILDAIDPREQARPFRALSDVLTLGQFRDNVLKIVRDRTEPDDQMATVVIPALVSERMPLIGLGERSP